MKQNKYTVTLNERIATDTFLMSLVLGDAPTPKCGLVEAETDEGRVNGLEGNGREQGLEGNGREQGLEGNGREQGLEGKGREQGLEGNGREQGLERGGQFVDVAVEGRFLRRPFAATWWDDKGLTIIYKVVGEGTKEMTGLREGSQLDLLTGLGNGFDASASGQNALVVTGGLGASPAFSLVKELKAQNKNVTLIMGFNRAEDIVLEKEYEALGVKPVIVTLDGSKGMKGLVTDAIAALQKNPGSVPESTGASGHTAVPESTGTSGHTAVPESTGASGHTAVPHSTAAQTPGTSGDANESPAGVWDYFYTCGPKVMMKAVCSMMEIPGEASLEERMGCGCGICYGCTCHTADGPRRVCADGPVFKKDKIIW